MQRASSRDLSSLFQKIIRQTAYFRFSRDWHPEIGFPEWEWELGKMHVLLLVLSVTSWSSSSGRDRPAAPAIRRIEHDSGSLSVRGALSDSR